MRQYVLYILLCLATFSFAQNENLAKTFFDDGEYQKALIEYNKLLTKQPSRSDYLIKKIKCLQELEKFDLAEIELQKAINNRYSRPNLLVELGYNYALQKDTINAKAYYDQAIKAVQSNPNTAYSIGKGFEDYGLLSEAKKTYTIAMALNEKMNFDFQLARIYGQLNEIEKMFGSYLSLLSKNKQLAPNIQQLISQFISEDPTSDNNLLLKRALLRKLQATPDILWNEQLSWLYVQQKDFGKAFIQEKAIYKREGQTLDRIFDLALTAKDAKDYPAATTIFNFIKEEHLHENTLIRVHQYILEMQVLQNKDQNYSTIIDAYSVLFQQFGIRDETLNLQLGYVDVLAFRNNEANKAINFLKEHQDQRLGKFNKARYQMKLADILVATGQFNQALINYSKIQRSLKNDVLSQEARYKVAKTSYYKGDFNWALQQLSVLKSSTSQLIANDALDLHLLINDHTKGDTLHIALSKYAKADLLAFQNKTDEAITLLSDILEQHKGDKIEDDALFLQASLYEQQGNYQKAIANYEFIINTLQESIFIDDSLYKLASLYLQHFNDKEKAKNYFQTIIFNHADSIHFVKAQKQFRKLRGDSVDTIN